MKYIEVSFHITPYSQTAADLLAALLGEEGFETFAEAEGGLVGYVQQPLWHEEQVRLMLDSFPMPGTAIHYEAQDAPYQDWNQVWEEEGFQPVIINERIVVHDTRHTDVPRVPYDICISPRQAFGTGSHGTTRMLLEWLAQADLQDKEVVDAGTGTGVLGIMCVLRGAAHVLAYDIDEWSVDNARDNLLLNGIGTAKAEVRLGDASVLKHAGKADMLMANINRNILLADMQQFADTLKPGGELLLSGFYEEDIPMLQKAAKAYGLRPCSKRVEDRWAMLLLRKRSAENPRG